MPRIQAGDIELNYIEHGSGDKVVLAVHGNLGCAHWLDLALPLLPAGDESRTSAFSVSFTTVTSFIVTAIVGVPDPLAATLLILSRLLSPSINWPKMPVQPHRNTVRCSSSRAFR